MAKLRFFTFIDPKPLVFAAACALIGLGTAGLVTLLEQTNQDEQSWQKTQATVVRFGGIEGKWNVGKVVVTAEAPDGLVGQAIVRQSNVQGCVVGDTIPAIRSGSLFKLRPKPCRH